MAKPKKKLQARKLRKKGESIKVIAKRLGVSPSSVSRWCRDIKLSSKQIAELERRARDPNYGGRLRNSLKQQQKRIEKTRKLKKIGIKEVGGLSDREIFLVGVALYWAEGFKKDSQAGLASSDPAMINFFLKWLVQSCGYKLDQLSLRVTANISHEYRIEDIQKFWSEKTGIALGNFQKPYFQKVKWKKEYESPEEYFGVLRVKVRKSTDFLRKIKGWIEGLRLYSKY